MQFYSVDIARNRIK